MSTSSQDVRITSSQSVTLVRSPDSLLFLQPQNLFLFTLVVFSLNRKIQGVLDVYLSFYYLPF